MSSTVVWSQTPQARIWLKTETYSSWNLTEGGKRYEREGKFKVLSSPKGNKGTFTCQFNFKSNDKYWPLVIKKGSKYLQPTIWYDSYQGNWVLKDGTLYKIPEDQTKYSDIMKAGIGHWMDNYYWKSCQSNSWLDVGLAPKHKAVPLSNARVEKVNTTSTKESKYSDGTSRNEESGTLEVSEPSYNAATYNYHYVCQSEKTWCQLTLTKENENNKVVVFYNAGQKIFEPSDDTGNSFSVTMKGDDSEYSEVVKEGSEVWMSYNRW